MLASGVLAWLAGDQQLMELLSRNWLLGVSLVACVVFLETGLVVLPFLPGDSLLFATGAFLGASGILPLWPVVLITAAAVAGDGLNFLVGRSPAGQWLAHRRWIKPPHLQKTREYFDRFGGSTVTIARFVPIVRTITPFLAGMSGMEGRRFALFNVIGGLLWCPGLLLSGYWLGGISWVRDHMQWLTLGIVVVSLLPVGIQLLRARRTAAARRSQAMETLNARTSGRR
ncbi:VTT domain-containing protein [Cupriavidus numazuensis]|uniref:Protein DedA n=1 Tax=Cupriavidus numazuensis TaxID=221992 RepID=A0ABM8TSH9_9BURK|nr:VTT domain-containing protein [Cupriavidus numazuensis]CAG2159271.1 Protein DedA [Cupriavidus numazuensis]